MRAASLAKIGGVPAVALGEDRALFTRLRWIDARIRHAPDVTVTVSGRVAGRARGGMADTIARRLRRPDEWLDESMEPASDHALRAVLRRAARDVRAGRSAPDLADALMLPAGTIRRARRARTFGRAWRLLESASPRLGRRAVPVSDLVEETASAQSIVESLRGTVFNASEYPGDKADFSHAESRGALAASA